jgi:hypothetical protein
MINGWQSETDNALKFVTPAMLFAAIGNMSTSTLTFGSDQPLGAFDWSSFARLPVPETKVTISMSITAFSDSSCVNMTSTYLSASNPLVFNDAECSGGPVYENRQVYVRAVSCGAFALYSFATDQQTCTPLGQIPARIETCFQDESSPKHWLLVKCSGPPADPTIVSPSGAMSPAVIAGVVIGTLARKPHIRSVASPPVFFFDSVTLRFYCQFDSSPTLAVVGLLFAVVLQRNR